VKKFDLPLMAAVSTAMLALTGCSSDGVVADQPTRFCVGRDDVRVDEMFCNPETNRDGFYHWYYLSRGGRIPYMGGYAHGGGYYSSGGSYSSPPATASGTIRGGFGSSAHSSGGGAGE
jgi:hypothetical protein